MALTFTEHPSHIFAWIRKPQFIKENYRSLFGWPIAAMLVALCGWVILFDKLDRDRQDVENTALREVAALSRSYADHLSGTLSTIDQIILHVKFEWEMSNGKLRLENIRERGLFPSSFVFHAGIIDRNGVLVTGTYSNPSGPILRDLKDRPYFLAQQNADKDFLYIGDPVIARNTKNLVIQFSRRLTDRDGKFAGVVYVAVTPDYFTRTYDSTTLGSNGFMGLIGTDGGVRAARIGRSHEKAATQSLLAAPDMSGAGGSLMLEGDDWFADKRSRFVGWQPLDGYPLIALTGLDVEDTLASFRADRAALINSAILDTIALAVLTLIAVALSMRLAWGRYQVEQLRTTYRLATEEGNEGFYILHPLHDQHGNIVDFQTVDCNSRGAELFNMTRDQYIGRRLSSLYQGPAFQRVMGRLRQAMDLGLYEGDLQESDDSPMVPKWVHVKIVRSGCDLASTVRDISDSKNHIAELERRSNEDILTGLRNRQWVQAYLPREIERAKAANAMLALLFIDLDGFKTINDTLGHAAGDELLRSAARRLTTAARPYDKVARLGSDEFVVIVDKIAHTEDVALVAQRVLQAFEENFKLAKGTRSVGASIGISVFPADGTDAATLLQNADVAMYSVKTSGKGSYRFFEPHFHEALRERLEREFELRHAIAHDQFVMYYQPRVDISTGTTASMEALVRWAHPTRGMLAPGDFVPLAEETGLILGLGELVIDKVCAQLAYWAKRNQDMVPVSINVSPRQFNEVNIADIFARALARHAIEPRLVEIEVTESSMMGENHEVSKALHALQQMGIKLSIDDFGTGYSSLSQLQQMDFDVLKVDQAFTAKIEKTEQGKVFFTAIVTMAHALGMRVVAEGVENLEQIKILKSLHCDEIQGFYISKPLPASDAQPILPKWYFPTLA